MLHAKCTFLSNTYDMVDTTIHVTTPYTQQHNPLGQDTLKLPNLVTMMVAMHQTSGPNFLPNTCRYVSLT